MPRIGKKKSLFGDFCNCDELFLYLDCRCVPHGFYAFIPTVLCTMAFFVVVVQDGCDYANLSGGNIEIITGSDVIPFIEAGVSKYRAPLYYPTEGEWKMVFTETCKEYPPEMMDSMWLSAVWMTWLAGVFGGAVAFFLWFTTCFTFSPRTWYFCAFEAALAGLLRAGSFLFFFSSVCTGSETSCARAFGSKMDIAACVLWGTSAIAMMTHYPDPRLRRVTDTNLSQQVAEAENLQPKRLSSGSIKDKRPSLFDTGASYRGGGGGGDGYQDDPDRGGSFYDDQTAPAEDYSYKERDQFV